MNVPDVTVLMSAYNGGSYLHECVESIIRQSYNNFEFIIVDDGSTDDTWNTLKSYSERDQRIVLLKNQPNIGVVRALNKGLDIARGDIIARQDADDISHPERIQKQLEFLGSHPDIGLVAAVPLLIDQKGTPLNHRLYTATENTEIQEQLLDHMCLCGPTIMIRRKCLERAGFYFTEGLDASEDYDICLRLAEVTKLASLEGSLYYYRQQPDSASNKRAAQQMMNKAIALELAISRRYGIHPPAGKMGIASRDYLHATIIAFSRGDLERAHHSLSNALRLNPLILERKQPLEDLIRAYNPGLNSTSALEYTKAIFENFLPRTKYLAKMRSRLLSYIHFGQVFDSFKKGDFIQVDKHLWPGIRQQPSWLFNRGVAVIVINSMFRKIHAQSKSPS